MQESSNRVLQRVLVRAPTVSRNLGHRVQVRRRPLAELRQLPPASKAMQIQREQQRLLLHTQRPSLCMATSTSWCQRPPSTSQNWEASPAHLIHILGVAKHSPCRRRCVDAGLCTSSDASPRHQAEIRRCHALPNETHISTFTTPGYSDTKAVETNLWMISPESQPNCNCISSQDKGLILSVTCKGFDSPSWTFQ